MVRGVEGERDGRGGKKIERGQDKFSHLHPHWPPVPCGGRDFLNTIFKQCFIRDSSSAPVFTIMSPPLLRYLAKERVLTES